MKSGKPIKFYRTLEEGNVPPVDDIQQGEMALNLFAGKEQIFVKNSNGEIAPFYSGKRTEALETRAQNMEMAITGLNQLDDERSKVIDTLTTNVSANTSSINNLTQRVDNYSTSISANAKAISDEKKRAQEQENLKLDKARYQGITTVTSLANIPITKRLVISNVSAGSQISLASVMPAGEEVHVIIKNTGTAPITIPVPNKGTYISTGSDSLTIAAGKYGEINFVSDGTKVFVRGL